MSYRTSLPLHQTEDDKPKRTVTKTRTKSPTKYTQSTTVRSPQDEETSRYSYRTGVKKQVTNRKGKTKSKSITVGHKGAVNRRRLPSGAAGGIMSNEGSYKQTTNPKTIKGDAGYAHDRHDPVIYKQTKVRKSGKSVTKQVSEKKANRFALRMDVKGAYKSSHKEAGGKNDFGGKKGQSSGYWGGGKGKNSSKFNIQGKNPLYMWGKHNRK